MKTFFPILVMVIIIASLVFGRIIHLMNLRAELDSKKTEYKEVSFEASELFKRSSDSILLAAEKYDQATAIIESKIPANRDSVVDLARRLEKSGQSLREKALEKFGRTVELNKEIVQLEEKLKK